MKNNIKIFRKRVDISSLCSDIFVFLWGFRWKHIFITVQYKCYVKYNIHWKMSVLIFEKKCTFYHDKNIIWKYQWNIFEWIVLQAIHTKFDLLFTKNMKYQY